jgi:hypothetical protein
MESSLTCHIPYGVELCRWMVSHRMEEFLLSEAHTCTDGVPLACWYRQSGRARFQGKPNSCCENFAPAVAHYLADGDTAVLDLLAKGFPMGIGEEGMPMLAFLGRDGLCHVLGTLITPLPLKGEKNPSKLYVSS